MSRPLLDTVEKPVIRSNSTKNEAVFRVTSLFSKHYSICISSGAIAFITFIGLSYVNRSDKVLLKAVEKYT